jgi:hypothetical protein
MDRHNSTARTFVPPTETNIYEGSRRPNDSRQVFATWLENSGAGIGAAAVLVALWLAAHGLAHNVGWAAQPWPDPAVVAVAAAIVALLAFGALMLLRASLDEIVQASEWNQAMADMAELEAENERLADRLAVRTEELRQLRAEMLIANRERQARTVQYVAPAAPDTHGIDDARTLLERATRKMDWSRDVMKSTGWTQPQWELARDTLIAANLLAYNGRQPRLVLTDYEQACSALEEYKVRISTAEAS